MDQNKNRLKVMDALGKKIMETKKMPYASSGVLNNARKKLGKLLKQKGFRQKGGYSMPAPNDRYRTHADETYIRKDGNKKVTVIVQSYDGGSYNKKNWVGVKNVWVD